jgi:ABC-type bacteriocin/lantibiotic exporter with double-glycine peptidase domain
MLFGRLTLMLFLLYQFSCIYCIRAENLPLHSDVYSAKDIKLSDTIIQGQPCCAPIALSRCLVITGNKVQVQAIVEQFKTMTTRGVNFSELLDCTRKYYPNACAVIIRVKDLATLSPPAIIILKEQEHCLVYEYFDAETSTFSLWNPTNFTSTEYSEQDLTKIWSGEIILLDKPEYAGSIFNVVIFTGSFLFMVFTIFLALKSQKLLQVV